MSERKYSVTEIDRMREAVEHQWIFGRKISEPEPNRNEVFSADGSISFSIGTSWRSYNDVENN